MRAAALALLLLWLPQVAVADPAIRPPPRPDTLSAAPAPAAVTQRPARTAAAAARPAFAGAAPARSVRPPPRPVSIALVAAPPAAPRMAAVQSTMSGGAVTSPRPQPRPADLALRRPGATLAASVAPRRAEPGASLLRPQRGALCGDPAIRGEKLAPITGAVRGCGIDDPVRVTEVDGVRLSTPATLDCGTARALRQWVETGLKPAVGRAGLREIQIAAHYTCRPRNNRPGQPISEHGRGRAIDIAGIRLGNGQMVSVLGDYRSSRVLQQARRAACGIFGTTLGPGSDRFHADHFHFDTARHRNGPYCR